MDVLAHQGITGFSSLSVVHLSNGANASTVLPVIALDCEKRVVVTNQTSIDGEWMVVSNGSTRTTSTAVPSSGGTKNVSISGFVATAAMFIVGLGLVFSGPFLV